MRERKQFTAEIGGKTLVVETSSLAEQANGAVLVKYGETVVLGTVVMGKEDAGTDYLPLKIDYEERFYAAGKIMGSRFIRREGRPSEEAVLTGRMIDRVVRPLFDWRIRRDIQVVLTVLSYDEANDPDFPGLIAASTALAISDVPWEGPVGGVRVAKVKGEWVVNPEDSKLLGPDCSFEAFVAGPEGKINMIECSGGEASEDDALRAFEVAQVEIDRLIGFEKKIVSAIGKEKAAVPIHEHDPAVAEALRSFLGSRLEEAIYAKKKEERDVRVRAVREEAVVHLALQFPELPKEATAHLFETEIDALVHRNALVHDRRPDGRDFKEIRPLSGEVGLFERTHGSGLFVRGDTQALAVTTLAPPGAEQLIETMEVTGKRRFMLHYNFPPYSTGEVGRLGSPGRREIGHGALAEKALRSLIPSTDQFPYTIRVVSEILSSNGSTSMATVCASTLSLMDAGVPLKKPVAGIAMGLMSDEKEFRVLTDLQGYEDFYGDMDFKVAGTKDGITAIQLDTKIRGLSIDMIRATLEDARAGRLAILDVLSKIIASPRKELSSHVPAIFQLKINPEKIGTLIGPGGKMINGLIKRFGLASIDVEEDGSVFVSGTDQEKAKEAVAVIKSLTREFRVGEIIEGPVIKVLDFGAIVDLGGGKDGMIHVSELKEGYVKKVEDVVKMGNVVRAKVIRADEDGKIGLSLRGVEK